MEQNGKKQDNEKLDWSLLPIVELEELIKVMQYGKVKYNENPRDPNWMKVENGVDRYYAALLRHLVAWKKGDYLDDESGLPHLSHAIFNVICLSYHARKELNTTVVESLIKAFKNIDSENVYLRS